MHSGTAAVLFALSVVIFDDCGRHRLQKILESI